MYNHLKTTLTRFWRLVRGTQGTEAPRPLTYLSVYEIASGDFVVSNNQVVAEERDGRLLFRFFRPNGTVLKLNLSNSGWRIVRHPHPIDWATYFGA